MGSFCSGELERLFLEQRLLCSIPLDLFRTRVSQKNLLLQEEVLNLLQTGFLEDVPSFGPRFLFFSNIMNN